MHNHFRTLLLLKLSVLCRTVLLVINSLFFYSFSWVWEESFRSFLWCIVVPFFAIFATPPEILFSSLFGRWRKYMEGMNIIYLSFHYLTAIV